MNTAIPKMWYELFEMWLRSMGINPYCADHCDYRVFLYNDIKFIYGVNYNYSTHSHFNEWRIGMRRKVKSGVHWLTLTNVDIQDPSFDPDKFFEPFKRDIQQNQDGDD